MSIKFNISTLLPKFFPSDDFKLDDLVNAIKDNQDFSTENLEVKKDELGPKIMIKARDEDGIINATKQLTKVYKQNPHLKLKIYYGLKLEENSEKLLTTYLASESELPTPQIDGERSFGHNLIADKILYKLREIDRKINNGITIEIKNKTDQKKNNTLFGSIKKHKKALFATTAAMTLGLCIAYPSLVKGKLAFYPYLTLNHLSQTIQNINPILLNLSNNIRYLPYLIPAFKIDEDKMSKNSRKLKYALLALGLYEIGDLLGLPGLIDFAETAYLAYNMRPSNAIYPWEWKWNRCFDLALKLNDINSLIGIMTKNSDLFKLINYYNQVTSLIPEDRKIYYTLEELDSLGYKLVSSLFTDNKISNQEENVIRNLMSWKRWWIVRDIINSGMIDDKNLEKDWDKDKLNNITEILQGTNPLNDLETDPKNLSERYDIILDTTNYGSNTSILLYQILSKNGHNNIIYFYENQRRKNLIVSKFFKPSDRPDDEGYLIFGCYWLKPETNLLEDYPVKVNYLDEKVTKLNFLNEIKNLPSDKNDVIFIYYIGHGPGPGYFLGDRINDPNRRHMVSPKEFSEVLAQIEYGRVIFVNETCRAAEFVTGPSHFYKDSKPLIEYNPINLVAISSSSPGESVGSTFSSYFFRRLMSGLTIREAFEYARLKRLQENIHPTIWYNCDDSWLDRYNILKYVKARE